MRRSRVNRRLSFTSRLFQAEKSTTDAEKKASEERIAEMNKSKASIDTAIKQGQDLQKKGDYESARAVYMKLEKIKGYAGQAYFYQATVAYDEHDTSTVTALADKAVHNLSPGPMKFQAMLLYGDGQVQLGNMESAKTIFAGVAKQTTGDLNKQALRKLANVNKLLSKPEKDGL